MEDSRIIEMYFARDEKEEVEYSDLQFTAEDFPRHR